MRNCSCLYSVTLGAVLTIVQLVYFLGILGNFKQLVGFLPATLAIPGFASYKFVRLVFFDTILL